MITFLVGLKSNKADLDQLSKIFKRLDSNEDGHLSKMEIQNGIQQHAEELSSTFGTEIDFNELFDVLDVNCDGVIDYDEFIRGAYDRVKLFS